MRVLPAVLDELISRSRDADGLRSQADAAFATGGCDCGCGTINLIFPAASPARVALPDGVAAEADIVDEDGEPAGGVILFVRSGVVDRLEVHSYDKPLPMPPLDRLVRLRA